MGKNIFIMATLAIHASWTMAADLTEKIDNIAFNAEVHNGDSYVDRYEVSTFRYSDEIKKAEQELNGGECQYYLSSVGRRKTIKAIADDQLIGDAKTSTALLDIYNEDKKQIKGAFMFAWEGESGDSEYCLKYPTYVYFNNGEKLTLSYDYTD